MTEDIGDRFHFNTAIAAVMELVNQMYQVLELPSRDDPFWPVMKAAVEAMILLISPHCSPHCGRALAGSGTFRKRGEDALAQME